MDKFGLNPTNTMASNFMSFNILKMDDVEDPLIDVNKLTSMYLDECYFLSGINFIKEQNEEINKYKTNLYKSISEATETYVVHEAFGLFFARIDDIVRKVLDFFVSLVKRFSTALSKIVESNRYLIKHKDTFSKMLPIDNFEFDGFTFSISPDVPVTNVICGEFNKDLFSDLYDKTSNPIDGNDFSNAQSNLENFDYGNIRGKIIGKNYSINESDFATELFRVYRNGKSEASKFTVNNQVVNNSLNRYSSHKDTLKEIERNNKAISKEYNEILKQVKNVTKRNGDLNAAAFVNAIPGIQDIENTNGYISSDLMTKIDIYIKAKCDQITQYSNIHILAFTAKLDAVKDMYMQDRTMLYTALSRIQRSDIERGIK